MTQEDKELLLKDLCARLPYGVKVKVTDVEGFTFEGELRIISKGWCKLHISDPKKKARVKNEVIPLNYTYIKPYLRPMSSMTDKEYETIRDCFVYCGDEFIASGKAVDFLNSNYFDYRDLISKGLALEAPEDMYK